MYGRLFWSERSGSREVPMTRSISSLAFFCTDGLRAMAIKKQDRAETVYARLAEIW